VTVSQADLLDGADNNEEFVAVVHPVEDGEIGAPVGNTDTLTGTNSDLTVALDEPVEERGDQKFVAMLHFADDEAPFGEPIPNAEAGQGFIDGGVADSGVVTLRAPADFQILRCQPS